MKDQDRALRGWEPTEATLELVSGRRADVGCPGQVETRRVPETPKPDPCSNERILTAARSWAPGWLYGPSCGSSWRTRS
jgi:hypothetical protein